MAKTDLKKIAKKIYFKQTPVRKYRKQFLMHLKKVPVVDLRKEGYYCNYCKKVSKSPNMTFLNDTVVYDFANGKIARILIVKPHYDGCRGWN